MSGLEVWLDDREAGWLRRHEDSRPSRALSMRYLESWIAEAPAYPLAPSLPLPERGGGQAPLDGEAVRWYFDNLLPEGDARRRAFAALGVPMDDTFRALAHMGRDAAGAVRLLPGDSHGRPTGSMPRRVPREELSERIRHRTAQPFAVWDGQMRHALAGSQDKIGVYVDRGEWYLVDGPQIASTHLIKPAPEADALRDLPYNEYFCMRLAARVGLDVAKVQLHHVPEPVLLVERFDRQRLDDGRVRRRHVIDACQALGVPGALKRERTGEDVAGRAPSRDGVSMPRIFGLLTQSAAPLIDRRALLRWTIFQLLIGNSDAHAKNLSFFVDHGGLRVAPAYDLICGSRPGFGKTPGLAMAIGDAFVPNEVTPLAWASFAERCGIAPRSLIQELRRLCEELPTAAERLAAELADEVPGSVGDGILSVIRSESARQASTALDIGRIGR